MWTLFLFVLPLATGALTVLLLWLAEGTRFQIRGLVGPFFVSISFIFGLLVSLVTSDLWTSITKANTLLNEEASALRAMLRIANADPTGEAGKRVRPLIDEFVDLELRYREAGATLAGEPLQRIRDLTRSAYEFMADPKAFGGDSVMRTAFMQRFEAVRETRFQRLATTSDRVAPAKLALLILTGFMTQIAIAMVHAGAQRAMVASVLLFSLNFSLYIAALQYFQTHLADLNLISWRALEIGVH